MKKILIIIVLAIQFYNPCIAQDCLKSTLVNYLLEKGELLSGEETKDYYNSVFYVELVSRNKELNQKYGVYKFGTISPDTDKYILIKNDTNYEILDFYLLPESLEKVIAFLKIIETPPETILEYVDMILLEYRYIGGGDWVDED